MNRLTIRTRLTLVYGALLLIAGLLLLGVTYTLVSQQLAEGSLTHSQDGPEPPEQGRSFASQITVDARRDALDALLTQGGLALVVVGVAAIAFGWLIAGGLLRPLHRITETAQRIADAPDADRGLHERIALDGPNDEIKQLADTFDTMLERLDHSFDGQRRFIANASHELRTPLTLNRTLLEIATERDSAPPEIHQLAETLLAINARHERLIEGLLLLARSEQAPADHAYVDLADIVEHVAAQARPGPVTIHLQPAEAPTIGNPVLLERLVQNLVENGVRHNIDESGWVRISSETDAGGGAVLRVSNTGPVVPRYEIPNLFEPFRRLGTDRTSSPVPGAGLGLSIVRAVAHAHGGQVHAEPRDGGGLTVTVALPARTAG